MRNLLLIAFLALAACTAPQSGNNSGGAGGLEQDAPTS